MAELKKKRKIKQSKAFVEGELIEDSVCRRKIKISSLKKKVLNLRSVFLRLFLFIPFCFGFKFSLSTRLT